MIFSKPFPGLVKTEPYTKTKYVCTNKACGRMVWRSSIKRQRCSKCFHPMSSVEDKLVIPKEMVCSYCKSANCSRLTIFQEKCNGTFEEATVCQEA